MVVVGKGQVPEMFSLVVVVAIAGKTFWVVVIMVVVRIRIWSLLTRLLLPGQLLKAMSNRAQSLHLFGVLLPYQLLP